MDLPAHQLVREGAAQIEFQERRGYVLSIDSAGRLHGCALGAIVLALEGAALRTPVEREYLSAIRDRYWSLLHSSPAATQPCPGHGPWPWQGRHHTCDKVARLGNQVAHLNDRHGWSFKRIADWLQREHGDWLLSVATADFDTELHHLNAGEAIASVEELLRLLADASKKEDSFTTV